ncbi:gamma-aminobutyric acid receptor subunit rho-2-like [Littorina saxatilis]|uniref:gamma-aminobutyric acid receptor subunit rho-2-like n=1 Tax=Littorina saxatilis TaxID=31220 RepID=UPI0038B461E2
MMLDNVTLMQEMSADVNPHGSYGQGRFIDEVSLSRKLEDALEKNKALLVDNATLIQQLSGKDLDDLRHADSQQFCDRLIEIVGHQQNTDHEKMNQGWHNHAPGPHSSDSRHHVYILNPAPKSSLKPSRLEGNLDLPLDSISGYKISGPTTSGSVMHPSFTSSRFGNPATQRTNSSDSFHLRDQSRFSPACQDDVGGHDLTPRPIDGTPREYDHQVTVELKCTFLKINDIDTLSQQFEAEVYIQAKWEEVAFVSMSEEELDLLTHEDLWSPYLIISNAAGEFDHERRSFVVRYEEGYEAPVVSFRWRFKGLFREPLELAHFPFDVQDLTVDVSTERCVDEIKMKQDQHALSAVSTRAFQDSHEWTIYKHVECTHHTSGLEYASSTIHPIIVFSTRVRRKVWYFVWNIVLICFLVMLLSFMTISIEPSSSDRLSNTMTLFLTMVAFKLVVKQSLPTISYLTYLDIYVLGSMIYLVIFALENSAMITMGRWLDKDLVEKYDELFCMVLVFIVVTFHLVFIIHIQFTALKRHRLMKFNDRKYELDARDLVRRMKQKNISRGPKT